MKWVSCSFDAHGAAMLDIFNDAILNTTALYENDLRTLEFMKTWFAEKESSNHPILGLTEKGEDGQDVLVGFATYGVFRVRPCYRFTVEHSIYVDRRYRGRGFGKMLLVEIINRAEQDNYHVVVGVVDSSNTTSIALHEKCGFTLCGTIQHAGFKFDRWLDTCILQRVLKTPPGMPES